MGGRVPYRLIASDLDGTLLSTDLTVSERNRRALAAAGERGAVVVLVSGRPPRMLRLMAREAGVGGLAVCCNGAIVYDLAGDRLVDHTPIAPATAGGLVEMLRAELPDLAFAAEIGLTFACEAAYAERYLPAGAEPWRQAEAPALCAEPVTKLIVRHGALTAPELLERARALIGTAAAVTYSGAPFIEITAAGVDKASALARLCGRLGVGAAEVIAFGDMLNDLPLLAWAGHAVAVANAHPEVLALADEITLSNDDHGVAAVLERLLGDGRLAAPPAAAVAGPGRVGGGVP